MISKLKENKFDVVVIPRWGSRGCSRMHDKFCIIDMDYVMYAHIIGHQQLIIMKKS